MIEQALGNGSKYGLRIYYSHEPVILGTGGGIKQAEPNFSGEPVLVLNGDTLFELDLEALCCFHQRRQAAATLVLRTDADAARWGVVDIDADDRIVRITGRGRTDAGATQPRMFAGVHILHPRLLRDVPKGKPSSIIDAYVAAIQRDILVAGYELTGRLAMAIDRLRLQDLAATAKTYWFEIVAEEGRGLPPGSRRVADAWIEAGVELETQCVPGPQFWNTLEITDCPALVTATSRALALAAP